MPLKPVDPVTLTGRFVRLEPIEERHRAELRPIVDDPRIWPYMPLDGRTDHDFERMVDQALDDRAAGVSLPFVVRRLDDGVVVGSTRYLNIAVRDGGLEIGWTWCTPSVWAGPVNPDAKRLLLRHAFETLGAVRVALRCDARNLRSQSAILRLGAVKEGVLRRNMLVQHGHIRDTVYFSILDDEWPRVRDGLEARLSAFPAGPAAANVSAS